MVTGSTGLLGPYLLDAARLVGEAVGVARSGADYNCDLSDELAVRELLREVAPSAVIHAAGATNVDRCETDPEWAKRMNCLTTHWLAKLLSPSASLVFVSTDQVYPDTAGLKREGQEAPINVYGTTKLAAERAALSHPGAVILRCNMFGPSRTNGRESLSDWITRALSRGQSTPLFTDVYFSPLHFSTLAALVLRAATARWRGTYNLGSRDGCSKRDFAHMIARHLGLSLASAHDEQSTAVPGRAQRPRDLRMDVDRIEKLLNAPMPTLWAEVQKLSPGEDRSP